MPKQEQAETQIVNVEERTLDVKLTEPEVQAYALESAKLVSQIEQEELAESGRKKQAKEHFDGLKAHLRGLATKVRTGEEFRGVRCDIVHDYARGERRVVRQDTKAVVESRALQVDEMQRRLPLNDGDGASRAAPPA